MFLELGNIYSQLRDFEKANHYYKGSYNICFRNGAANGAARALNNLGLMYNTKYEFDTAVFWYHKGLDIAGIDTNSRVFLELNLGDALISMNQPEAAIQITLHADSLVAIAPGAFSESERLEHLGDIQANLAKIYQTKGQYEAAISHYNKLIYFYIKKYGNFHRQVAQTFAQLGELYATIQIPDSSLHYAQTALHSLLLNTPLDGDYKNPSSVDLYAEYTFHIALGLKARSLNTLSIRNPTDQSLLIQCLETCDLLFTADNLLYRDYAFDESKLYRQEEIASFYEIALSATYRLWQLTHDPKLQERAWQYADEARERLLVESLQNNDRVRISLLSKAQQKQWSALRDRIGQLQEAIYWNADAKANNDSLQHQLYTAQLNYKNILNSIDKKQPGHTPIKIDLSSIQRMLLPNQMLIEYFTGDSELFMLTLTRQEKTFIRTPKPTGFETTINQLLSFLKFQYNDNATGLAQTSSQLYDWLLAGPLNSAGPDINNLIIIRDGNLNSIPFEVLGKASASVGFKSFHYLVQQYTISYNGSIRLFQEQADRASQPRPGLALFAGFAPTYDAGDARITSNSRWIDSLIRDDAYNLPGAVKEVREISELMHGKSFLDEEATKKQFIAQAADFRILHLAMHAIAETGNPMFSRLIFKIHGAGDYLTASEIYNLQLPAELVVLSACNTGTGKIRKGEGVMSLARAFTYGGVPATIMSLWKASDTKTPEIMVNFYKNLSTGMRKDEALCLAKRQYLTEHNASECNPFFWAVFVGAGDMRAISGMR